MAQLPYAQRAARIYKAFGVDLPAQVIDELMAQAYGDNFDDERICPITSLDADTHVLELWHGPTSAFKDMALQCLPRFFSDIRPLSQNPLKKQEAEKQERRYRELSPTMKKL